MNLAQRTEALLALVQAQREQRCAELLGPAQAQARALVKAALADARRRVCTALAAERSRARETVAAAAARLATEQRLHRQREASRLLASATRLLREAMQARWDDAGARRQWIDSQLGRLAFTQGGRWQLEGPPGWAEDEVQRLCEALRRRGAAEVQYGTAPEVRAGFRVIVGHNRLDATLDGVLADRAAIEGQLLNLLQRDEPAGEPALARAVKDE